MSLGSGIQLQDRDYELFRGLFESRVMTLRHIAAIHFDGHQEASKKRVQRLKAAGFVGERSRSLQQPSILFLTRKAFETLRERGILEGYPHMGWTAVEKRSRVSELTLRHELDVMDVKAAFYAAVQNRPSFRIDEFSTWPRLNEFNALHPATGAKVTIKPDGFIRLRQTEADCEMEQLFFLEVDRSTETLEILVSRALCYRNYYTSGGLALRFGQRQQTYRQFPFRVLIVCKSERRRDNILMQLLTTNPPIRTFVWLSTYQEITRDPFGIIWAIPQRYNLKPH